MVSDASQGWIQKDENTCVTLFHGCSQIDVEKKKFQVIIYKFLKESCDITRVGKNNGKYMNAYEWLLSNLYRTAGIQLYSDYNIRINIIPAEVDFEKRCIFLTDAKLIDPDLNGKLYLVLRNLIYAKASKNVS